MTKSPTNNILNYKYIYILLLILWLKANSSEQHFCCLSLYYHHKIIVHDHKETYIVYKTTQQKESFKPLKRKIEWKQLEYQLMET